MAITAETAPVVMPIETPGYSAQAALTDYVSLTEYMDAGFVYVHAGCRGREAGAPAGVTDIKAAIRYLRYTSDTTPGDAEKIFVFGMSGGGAQSALVGATGDSKLYEPYLKQIGAVQGVSDAVYGSMDWCPIMNLDSADEAYEWMMGVTRSNLSDEEQKISDAMAGRGGALGRADAPKGTDGKERDGREPKKIDGENGADGMAGPDDTKKIGNKTYEDVDDITRTETSDGIKISGTYKTASDYIDALNANGKWVTYDDKTNKAKVTSVSDFVKAFKSVSKGIGAFDQLDAGQGENELFGYGDGNGAHFDTVLADILDKVDNSYAPDFEADLQKKDSVGYTVAQRVSMYTPLYYLLETEDGYGTSTPAKHWRIRTGIAQSDTALTTEVNLALALENYSGVESVDFATVWGQKHVKAERTGSSDTNFITWVNECMK